MRKFDFVVIGSGPAGQKAAIQAAKLGKQVALIERSPQVGGVSVHTGTIPSKTLREAALYLSGWDQRGLYGRSYRLKKNLTIDDLMRRLNITLGHETEVIECQLVRNSITLIYGVATFLDEHKLLVVTPDGSSEEIFGEKFLIAVGSRPVKQDKVGTSKCIIDSDGILTLDTLPKSMIVVGAGVIGVEYASIFATMDIKMTIVDGRSSLLSFLDQEIVDELIHCLRDMGITMRLNEKVAEVEEGADGKVTTILESGKRLKADLVLFAAGRIGCTYSLAPQNAGVEVDERRKILVNEHFQTSKPHIYAAGDVIGFPALASTSMEQGRRAARHAFDLPISNQISNFPFGIYSVPEISMVGMTEQELTTKKIPYEVGVCRLRETARGQIKGIEEGVLKMIFSLDDRRLLGVHIIGEGATELIHIGQAAIVLKGTIEFFIDNVFNYPTLAEAYKVAALDAWNRMSH